MEAKRGNQLGSRKCRAEYAIAVAVYDRDQKVVEMGDKPLISQHKKDFTYTLGQVVKPDGFDDLVTNECSNGIHFFITFEEARDY